MKYQIIQWHPERAPAEGEIFIKLADFQNSDRDCINFTFQKAESEKPFHLMFKRAELLSHTSLQQLPSLDTMLTNKRILKNLKQVLKTRKILPQKNQPNGFAIFSKIIPWLIILPFLAFIIQFAPLFSSFSLVMACTGSVVAIAIGLGLIANGIGRMYSSRDFSTGGIYAVLGFICLGSGTGALLGSFASLTLGAIACTGIGAGVGLAICALLVLSLYLYHCYKPSLISNRDTAISMSTLDKSVPEYTREYAVEPVYTKLFTSTQMTGEREFAETAYDLLLPAPDLPFIYL